MIQKLSVRQQSLETRLKVLKEIASEIGVTLHLEEVAPLVVEVGKAVVHHKLRICIK